jgi:hypothetical protein
MKIYTFDKLNIGTDGFYDLFEKTIVNDINLSNYYNFIVNDEFEGRLDLISKYLYGSTDFMEELMVINNIINPFSIKTGDILYYIPSSGDFNYLYVSDEMNDDIKDDILLMNKNKSTKKDINRIGYPPTIKPDNLKQIKVNYNNKKITIVNTVK